jgi:hypothetical protein
MPEISRNLGFDGRVFLNETEWQTYLRRKPVRYIRKKKREVCEVCGHAGSPDNPLQHAHIISFDVGVIELALTPDYLDQDTNIRTAHRTVCNQNSELNLRDSMIRLRAMGIRDLPEFLPRHIQELWCAIDPER